MITGPVFGTFTDAYLAVLREIHDQPRHFTVTRGKTAIETPNVSFTIGDPVARTPYLAARRGNIVFNHAEALWYLSGHDDLDMVAHYAPRLRGLSENGTTLTGTAYGPRLFARIGPDGQSQFDRVLAMLGDDPDTKRATMLIMRPDELADPANPDVACTLGLQFMLRAGRLHAIAYMRGNDAMIGLYGDTFAFTFIQEFAARLLDVEVGTYAHHVGSMHINTLDLAKVERILAEPTRPDLGHATMPSTAGWDDLQTVLAWEEKLRRNQTIYTADAVDLDSYWSQVIALFEVHRQLTHHPDQPVSPEALALLRPGHRWLVEQRWPDRMPAGVTP
ncbi:thymidylate synthase [Paractinoplanes rhizophilus]|uniref:Thymidylate synthase n=1 Tax=Paractinoplanes rhizophilus TaxID=1416877 RepID=A0ABW2HKN9_9ACTN